MKKTNRYTNTVLCLVMGTLLVSLSCKNMTEAPALSGTQAKVSFSVSAANERTVLPTMDIAGYRLFGGKTGATEEEQLAEFTTGTATVALEVAAWHFTLNAYNTAGDIVLQGKVQDKTIEAGGNNQVVFELGPLMTGKGNARIILHFPDYMGITKVTATGDLPEASADIEAGGGTYTWEQNDIDAGYYFVSFALYKGTEQVSVVSEMVLVGEGLTSGKTLSLSLNDLEPSLYTNAEGTTLTEKLDWLESNAVSDGNYLVEVGADESIAPHVLEYADRSGISITLIGLETVRTIDLASEGSMFIAAGVTLTLGNNITLKGRDNNTNSLVSIINNGRLILENGAVITGNMVNFSFISHGGGVYVEDGTFTMNGGEITGNTASSASSYGGGVYVESGTFMMNGGEITENTARASSSYAGSFGGGVHVESGIFTMSGGEITGNAAIASSFSYGGGVYVGSGTFTMNSGEITGNTAESSNSNSNGGGVCVEYGTFTMNGGEITGNTANSSSYSSSNGGGVCVWNGTFTMEGGEITGNTARASSSYAGSFGGGVHVESGIFTIRDGVITENEAKSGGGVRVNGGTFTMYGGEIKGNTSADGGGVSVMTGIFRMEGGEITGNTASSSEPHGGGVSVDSGTFTMNNGKITGNEVSGSHGDGGGGGVSVVNEGIFTMKGGEITGNTASGTGGGVYMNDRGMLTKTGGIITGYADDPVNGNVSKRIDILNRGHALYVYTPWLTIANKETTSGTTAKLLYTYIDNAPFWYGDWDDDGMPLSSTYGWSNHYIPEATDGELWYSFTVTHLSTYYIWWNDSTQGDGTKTGDIKVSAQYEDGTAIFTDVDSAYTTPRAFTAGKDGTVRVKVSPKAAGTTGTFGIVMRTENVRP